jgi:hypothetical protein
MTITRITPWRHHADKGELSDTGFVIEGSFRGLAIGSKFDAQLHPYVPGKTHGTRTGSNWWDFRIGYSGLHPQVAFY